MLIITRKCNESIIINNNIKVVFLGLNGHGQMKIGIDAPKNISVHREEVYKRILSGEVKTKKSQPIIYKKINGNLKVDDSYC